MKKLHNVIAVAAGSAKHVAIRAALRAHYPDILITDEDTARWLVKNI
ncbi:sugar-binding domain-containing protein [Treponema socranskii]